MPRSTTDLPALQAAVEQMTHEHVRSEGGAFCLIDAVPWPCSASEVVNAIKPLLRLAEAAVAWVAAEDAIDTHLNAKRGYSHEHCDECFRLNDTSNERLEGATDGLRASVAPFKEAAEPALDALSPKGEDR